MKRFTDKLNENQNIEIGQMGGIQCDNEKCDWSDMNIPIEEYQKYVGAKCPKCGEAPLLTQQEVDETNKMLDAVEMINKMSPEDLEKMSTMLSQLPEEMMDGVLDFVNKVTDKDEDGNLKTDEDGRIKMTIKSDRDKS